MKSPEIRRMQRITGNHSPSTLSQQYMLFISAVQKLQTLKAAHFCPTLNDVLKYSRMYMYQPLRSAESAALSALLLFASLALGEPTSQCIVVYSAPFSHKHIHVTYMRFNVM